MPEWNTTDRGTNREDDERPFTSDLDGYSCMELRGLPGYAGELADVERLPDGSEG